LSPAPAAAPDVGIVVQDATAFMLGFWIVRIEGAHAQYSM
jgi:hypothetical protein